MTDSPSNAGTDGTDDEYAIVAERWTIEGFREDDPFDAALVLHSQHGDLAAPLDPDLVHDLLDVLHEVEEAQKYESNTIGGPIGRSRPVSRPADERRYDDYDPGVEDERRGSRGWQNVTGYPQMNILWENMSVQARTTLCVAAVLVIIVLVIIPKIF